MPGPFWNALELAISVRLVTAGVVRTTVGVNGPVRSRVGLIPVVLTTE